MADSLRDACVSRSREFDYLKSWMASRSAEGAAGATPAGREAFEQFFAHIFNKSRDGISIHALDFTVVGVNEAMQTWYDRGRPLVGRKCYEAYHGRKSPCEHCPFELAVRTGRPQIGVVPYQVSGKVRGDQELSAFPLFDEQRQVFCVLEYVRDITGLERGARIVETLKRRIQLQQHALREQEAALAVLLRQGPKVEQRIAEEMGLNLEVLVLPLVARLKDKCAGSAAAAEVAVLEERLLEIASAPASGASAILRGLTAREQEVATLVRQGRTSKEIARLLCISAKAVEFHRTNVRKKLAHPDSAGKSLRALLLEQGHPRS